MPGCRRSTPGDGNGHTLPEPYRAAARHSRSVDPADPSVGAAVRVRHQPGHPRELRRNPAGGYWVPLSRLAPPRASKMDFRGLETLRKQAAHPRLPPHRHRQEAVALRTLALGTALRCHRRCPQPGQAWRASMKFPWRHDRKQQELEQELQSHLQMAASDHAERGESFESARQAARREFGNVELVQQVTRDQWGWRWLEELLQDLRFGARMLHKNPGFTLVAILTLALGIGANTAIFSVVNGVLPNPLPYPRPEQLVTLHQNKANFEFGSISYPNFRDWQKDNRTFSSMAISRRYAFSLTGIGEAEQVRGRFISSDFFSTVSVNPVLGREFAPGEDEIGAAPIALISAGFWKRKFGSSPDVLGKSLTLDGRNYTVVGVVPANFDLFLRRFQVAEIYVPIGQWNNPMLPKRGVGLGVHGIGRLKPGVSIEQARADMSEVSRNLAAAFPDDNKGVGASFIPLKQDMLGDVQPVLLVLLAAVVFVLLIACVNVANLLLARSTGRSREFAIRTALGAGRGRILRQLLTESILLALAGGALGLTLAQWGTQAALKHLPADLPRAAGIGLDARVLIFTAVVSLLAGILFGLAPALKTRTPELHNTLKEGGSQAKQYPGQQR